MRHRIGGAVVLVVVLAGCAGEPDDGGGAADAAAPSEVTDATAGDDGRTGAAAAPDEEDGMTEDGVQRYRSSGSERIVTDDAIATPAPRDGKAVAAAGEAVVEEAVSDRCAGPGLDLARGEGDTDAAVAGYATVLGALGSWRVEDGSSTRSVSIVDSSRPDDAEVAICYYDGRFGERAGRAVTRVGVVVYDDDGGRVVLRGTPDTLGLHRPPTT